MNVYIDTDVIISSFLSSKGAASLLIEDTLIGKNISTLSLLETIKVGKRFGLDEHSVEKKLRAVCTVIPVKIADITMIYGPYTRDEDDTHIIAGAVKSKARFLVTYNLRHFIREMILRDFNIITFTPGMLLQYLRSQTS